MAEATKKTDDATQTKTEPATPVKDAPAQPGTQTLPAADGGTLVTPATAKTKDANDDATQASGEPVVPEKYDLKLPDGSLLSTDAIEKTAAFAREQGFSNEEAQGLLEQKAIAVSEFQVAQKSELARQAEAWKAEVRADKEIGGENFTKSVELAKRVIDRFGSDSFKKALNDSGLGNHPEVVRIFSKIGRSAADDMLVVPSPQSATPKKVRDADLLYPTTAKKE